MRKIVILGAGTGGVTVASMLRKRLDLKQWTITIVDRAQQHVYQPGLIFIPFQLYDYRDSGDVARSIRAPLPVNVEFVQAQVNLIDHINKKVETSKGDLHYDWLVSSMGCHIAPELIDGMDEAMGGDVHTFYTLNGALALQKRVANMSEGRFVVNIAEMPIKCPVAPIEFAFLADYYFRRKGIRDRVSIEMVTPLDGVFTKPVATRVLTEIAIGKDIRIHPNFAIDTVDQGAKRILSADGKSLDYDILCAIPPNIGPEVLDDSDLGDGTGFALTHPRTLKSRKAEQLYLIGDNSNVSTSKAGSVAHFEAETVVENILREIDGKAALPSFDGHANCFIESGFDKALLIDFNYDMEPLPGSFPVPAMGPFSLLEESYLNHLGKLAFKWVYWHMLLPGHLAHVPLLPSHMSFLGKVLADVPHIQRAKTIHVADVMTWDVVTVSVGMTVPAVADLLVKHHFSGLPVVDPDGRLVGIVTEADLLSALNVKGEPAVKAMFDAIMGKGRGKRRMGTVVEDIMTPRPVSVTELDRVQTAVELMEANGIKRLIVVDDEARVKGVVARSDLMGLFRGNPVH